MFLEVGSPNSSVSRTPLPPKALGENPSLPLPAFGGTKHSLACGCITPVFASTFHGTSPLSMYLSPLCLIETCHWIRACLGNPGRSHLEILNLIIPAKTLLPNKVTFTDSAR